MQWFRRFRKDKEATPYYETYEKNDALKMFDELEELAIKTQKLQEHIKKLEKKQYDLELYENMTEDEMKQLIKWVTQYRQIIDQKQTLRGRLIKNNKSLAILAQYENELESLLKEVQITESKVKENERDLIYLEEEKEDTLEEREVLLQGYRFLQIFSVAMVFIMSSIVILGFTLQQVLREGIWVYFSIVSIGFVGFLGGLLYAKDRLEKGLRENELLQKKIIRYINKTKIRYFHNKRYLTFNFDKLGVDSSAKLEMYYNRYIKNKDNEKEYGSLNRQMMQIETKIIELFDKHDMVFDDMEALEEWVKTPKKATILKQLKEEQDKTQLQIKGFWTFEEELWREIYILKEDPKYTEIIEKKLQDYMTLTKQHLDKNL